MTAEEVDRLVDKFTPMVHHFANKYLFDVPVIEKEDLVSAGFEGLMTAIRKNDREQIPVRYIFFHIRGFIINEIRKFTNGGKYEQIEYTQVPCDQKTEQKLLANQILSKLNRRSSNLIRLRFYYGYTQQEIADYFGVTQGAITNKIKYDLNKIGLSMQRGFYAGRWPFIFGPGRDL